MSKKLLSVLVVLALALSLIPVVGLPATEANAASDVNKNLSFKADGKTAYCPHCKADVEWTDVNATSDKRIGTVGSSAEKNQKGHFYLSDNLVYQPTATPAPSFIQVEYGSEVCFHLNGHNVTYYGQIKVFEDSYLNVMGKGNATSYAVPTNQANYDGMSLWIRGTVTLYGGTWDMVDSTGTYMGVNVAYTPSKTMNSTLIVTGDAHVKAPVSALKNVSRVTLDKNAIVDQLKMQAASVLTIEGTWTGSATSTENLTVANHKATGMFTGTLLLDTDGIGTGTTRGYYITQDGATIIKVLACIGDVWYASLAKAVEAYTAQDFADGKVIQLHCNAGTATCVEGMSYYVDLNGFNTETAVKLAGAGTVYLLDSANDTYDSTKCGMATLPDGSTVIVKNDVTVGGKRYVTINDGTNYSAHRLEMKITTVTLKTSVAGIYYKASYKCDATLAAKVSAYGIYVSKSSDMSKAGYSALEGFATNMTDNTVTGNSGAVTGIFKEGASDNLDRAATLLYAKPYITVDGNTLTASDTVEYSLKTVLQAIDKEAYSAHWTSVKSFIDGWAEKDKAITAANLGLANIGA